MDATTPPPTKTDPALQHALTQHAMWIAIHGAPVPVGEDRDDQLAAMTKPEGVK
jgi:hypothetical protein